MAASFFHLHHPHHNLSSSELRSTFQYTYNLMLQYLHKTESIIRLGLLKKHTDFQVSPGQPCSISDDAEAVTLVSSGQDAANLINQKDIYWGFLEDTFKEQLEKAGVPVQASEKVDGETKEGEIDENRI